MSSNLKNTCLLGDAKGGCETWNGSVGGVGWSGELLDDICDVT
jgi:hypothetical protein